MELVAAGREERIAELEAEAAGATPWRLREIVTELAAVARRPDPRLIEVLLTTTPVLHELCHTEAFTACEAEPCSTVHRLVREGLQALLYDLDGRPLHEQGVSPE